MIGLSPGVLTPITVTIDNSGAAFASLDVRAGVTLDIDATIDNVGGVISANGGNVNLQSAFITGGTLETSNGGVFNIVNNHSVFDGTGGNTVSSTGNVDVDNNGLLVLQGAIDNTGTIALDSTGNSTTLQFDISGATLSGGGVVTMSDSPGNNYIQGNGQNGGASTDVLTNVNNTIEGVGTIGGNGLGLVNDGTIDANVSGATLIINNQGNNSPNSSEAGTVGNAGTLEATGSGTLLIQQTAIDNVGGVILANGGNVNLQSAFITGGALETFDGGVINIVNNGSVFDGTGGNTVSVTGNVDVDDNGLLVLQGAIDNTNTIALDSSGHSTTLQLDISGATLSGGGVVTMSPGDNYIQGNGQNGGAAGTDVLTNLSNTIEGVGTIGGNGMGLVNKSGGTIDADVSGATLIINNQGNNSPNSSEAGTVSNAGMLEATNSATLLIQQTAVDNVGGVISANGGNVSLQSAFITGGTLETSSGGVFNIVNNQSVLDGTGGNTVSSTGNVDVDNNGLLVLQGAIDNTGTIALDSSGNITTLQLDVSGAKLSGGGVVTMSDSPGNNYIQGNGQNGGGAGTDVLINVNNTIEGVGTIGGNGMGLVNKGGGTIDANISGTTLIVNNQGNNSPNSSEAGTVGNAGTLEATNSATLLIQQTAIDNIGGVISAAGGDVNLQSAFITGGTLETSSGGVINIVNNGSVFDGTGGNTVSNAGSVDVDDNGLLVLQGAIDNTGTIALDSSGHGTTLQFDISGATLSGGGVVTLSDSPGNNYIQGNGQNGGGAGTDVLTNVNNTIEGVGTIGGNGLRWSTMAPSMPMFPAPP